MGEVHLLHKAIPPRLEETAVLSNMQKPTQRVRENGGTKEYVPNRRTR